MAAGIPSWAKNSLQGITFWIGHRCSLFWRHPLTEGAIVAELCNLIHAHLGDAEELSCEVGYGDLVNGKRPKVLSGKARADLVVWDKPPKGTKGAGAAAVPQFVIEVKRASSPKGQIDLDLRRLAAIRVSLPGARAFLFLVSEGKRPNRFVSEEGVSRSTKLQIDGTTNFYKVRRTFKASQAFTRKNSAHYACLIEVL